MANLVEVFDEPTGCSSGACTPEVSDRFLEFNAAVEWLRGQGVRVERYDPNQQCDAFFANSTVVNMINVHGIKCLPLILVDGNVIAYGAYPSPEELAAMAGIEGENEAVNPTQTERKYDNAD